MNRIPLQILLVCAAAALALGQEPPAPAGEQQEGPPGRPGARAPEPVIRPYEKVITKEAKTKQGVFTVHQIKEKYYYEIPKAELGKDFLWVNQIARTTSGVGYGGQALGSHVVRWERRENRVYLKKIQFDIVAEKGLPIARAVAAANNDTILKSFNIEAIGKDDAPVIEVTSLFATELTEFSARQRLRARGFDASRSYVERITAFPLNIEAEATHTYTSPPETGASPFQAPRPEPSPMAAMFAGMRPGSATVVLHFSMVKLPEKPMMPRLYDERVGYFTARTTDYGVDEQRAPQRRYITRWRLEKKDPGAELSEPVKPIVYYVDAATPAKWVPYVKQGIEDWQPAFEAAGFKNAIIGKLAPTPEQDPDFSPEDARYAVIRWLPSTIENASGPHIHDPRSGEILDSDIQFYHNVMNLNKSWYFLQAGPLDPRAQKLPLPDDLMGELIRYVVAHEVGHTLGFQHNMKASSLYPIEKIRDREWLKKMGHTPTLMDYSRFNYVAQPEDKIPPADLIPKIGPYDKWATMWGYKPIPGAKTADEEKPTLDAWAREQDKTPWLRFSTDNSRGADPGELTEAVGDADAVAATELGIKNLQRVAKMLLGAAERKGEDWEELDEVYGRMLGQWARELTHVAAIAGGMETWQRHGGQNGVRFRTLPRERQQKAVAFLNANAFQTPKWALDNEILRRIEPEGALNRVKTAQMMVLNSLLSDSRLARMVEQEATEPLKAYRPADLLADLRTGIWSEAALPKVQIDAYRRNLQRGYLEAVNNKLNGRTPAADESRALFRSELRTLNAELAKALPLAADRATRAHLEDARDQIARILDPKFAPPASSTTTGPAAGRPGADEEHLTCWPDLIIR